LLQIPSRAEVPVRAVEHGHPRLRILVEREERVIQQSGRRRIDGIAHLRPIERDDRYRIDLLHLHRGGMRACHYSASAVRPPARAPSGEPCVAPAERPL